MGPISRGGQFSATLLQTITDICMLKNLLNKITEQIRIIFFLPWSGIASGILITLMFTGQMLSSK